MVTEYEERVCDQCARRCRHHKGSFGRSAFAEWYKMTMPSTMLTGAATLDFCSMKCINEYLKDNKPKAEQHDEPGILPGPSCAVAE